MKSKELIFGTALTLILASCVFFQSKNQQAVEFSTNEPLDVTPFIDNTEEAFQFTLSANQTLIIIDSSGNQITRRGN